MIYEPITSFRRPVEAVHLPKAPAPAPGARADKWQILRDLTTARLAYDLGDRPLAVLQALLSFHPAGELTGDALIVYPSNSTLCERLNGMACSTMRRHLATLLDRGLIVRRDSPNGKRFVRRYRAGSEAFGFDLAPLLARAAEFRHAAEDAIAEREALDRRRRQVSLMRRDLAALSDFGLINAPDAANWTELADLARLAARDLRRRNDLSALDRIAADLQAGLYLARTALEPETTNPSINDREIEHHHQTSNKEYSDFDSEKIAKTNDHDEESVSQPETESIKQNDERSATPEAIPLSFVLSVCRELRAFTPDPIRNMADLIRSAQVIRPMLGITESAWNEAISAMGPDIASITVAAMLERFETIKSPGAYLRHLSRKCAGGEFSPIAMLGAIERSR
ncbi:plasmid replication protein RepC [Palleronia sp. LCG004]|uniref:plasmid replication protein RepC n=1 Tax=Palleronia sp. LCG004 TaxID=3079304 RepID=UPI002942462C|nr:plasmid replication protein RepC [Palleronia sp. LCG004]WOI58172.1 plasmid replication protein RepC [Palleronia sp. LCG004]